MNDVDQSLILYYCLLFLHFLCRSTLFEQSVAKLYLLTWKAGQVIDADIVTFDTSFFITSCDNLVKLLFKSNDSIYPHNNH